MIERASKVEYKFLKFSTHDKAEHGLNEMVAEGWRFVSYQAAGDASAITHFLLLEREARLSEPRRFGL